MFDLTGTFVANVVVELACKTTVEDDTIVCPWLSAVFVDDEPMLDLTTDETPDEEPAEMALVEVSKTDEAAEVDTVAVATVFADVLSKTVDSPFDLVDIPVADLECKVIDTCSPMPVIRLVMTVR